MEEADNADVFIMQSIKAVRQSASGTPEEYLVHWQGYASAEDSWEPAAALDPAAVTAIIVPYPVVTMITERGTRASSSVVLSSSDRLERINEALRSQLCRRHFVWLNHLQFLQSGEKLAGCPVQVKINGAYTVGIVVRLVDRGHDNEYFIGDHGPE